MDNGLVLQVRNSLVHKVFAVLILIVVDNGLVQQQFRRNCISGRGLNPYCSGQWSRTQLPSELTLVAQGCLNPYCSGQWSRTRPYKTILIINKLKNFTKQILTFLNRKLTIP